VSRRGLAPWACALIAGAAAFAGCGGGSPPAGIQRAVRALQSAVASGDARAACPRLLFLAPRQPRAALRDYLRALERPGGATNLDAVTGACALTFARPPAARRLLAALRGLTAGRVRAVSVDGPLARVTFAGVARRPRRMRFARAGGRWRLLLDGRLSAR
jgi:hypothetical protein